MSGALIRVPMARVDRLWRNSVVVAAAGPIEVPDRAAAVAAFAALAACGPQARVGLRFCPDSDRHWCYREDDLAEYAETCVVQLGPGADRDMDALMSRLPTEYGHSVAARIFLADRHVLSMINHAVGDSRLLVSMPAAIVAHATRGTLPEWAQQPYLPHPLRSALRHTFTGPVAAARLLSERHRSRRSANTWSRHRSSPGTVSGDVAAAGREWVPFRPMPVSVNVPGPVDGARAVRAWTSRNRKGAAHFATVLALVEQALTEQGVPCAPGAHMMFDLRRYLPYGHRTSGNFVAGLDLRATVQDPVRFTQVVTAAAKAGRPLAAVVMASALSAVSRLPGFRPQTASSVAARPAAQLAMSYVLPIRVDDGLPWTAPPSERLYWCRVDPAGPAAITLLVGMIGSRLQISASFHASVFEPERIRAALAAAHEDPIGLLQRSAERCRGGTAAR